MIGISKANYDVERLQLIYPKKKQKGLYGQLPSSLSIDSKGPVGYLNN